MIDFKSTGIILNPMIDPLCRRIIEELKINCVVETGTDKGETVAVVSRWFSEIDPDFGTIAGGVTTGARSYHLRSEPIVYPVFSSSRSSRYQIHSVDLDPHSYQSAQNNFKSNGNIHLYQSSSEKFLESFSASQQSSRGNQYLFFLDAHWGSYWPLRDEIKMIRTLNQYLIVIDDFFVPGKSNPSSPHGAFGFDVYQGRILNWNYIGDVFADTRARVFYPRRPNRDGRGWVMIAHGYSQEELKFLESLDVFEKDQNDPAHMASVKVPLVSRLDGRNLLKTLIPVSLLRSLHRVYEKSMQAKDKAYEQPSV